MPGAHLVCAAIPRVQQQIERAGRPRSARKLHAANIIQREQQRWLHAALGLRLAPYNGLFVQAIGQVAWHCGPRCKGKNCSVILSLTHPLKEAERRSHGKQPALAHLQANSKQLETSA